MSIQYHSSLISFEESHHFVNPRSQSGASGLEGSFLHGRTQAGGLKVIKVWILVVSTFWRIMQGVGDLLHIFLVSLVLNPSGSRRSLFDY